MSYKEINLVAYFKIFYLHLTYYFVGLEEEGFYYQKAMYLTELGHYFPAITALKKAEKNLKTSYVWGLLGWCYANVEVFEKSLYYYKLAYKTDKSESVLLGLAVSECHAGSPEKSRAYLEQLKPFRNDPIMNEYAQRVENELEIRKIS
ncbi:hypothetical protein [Teredinibacter haidensis]|uniref:hypothetical protein n=1 Tax=Teredinibacter haidensis TaxID=2731755 RepID=UPI00163BA773|nr:hypothetical protein [Teredinibacter haidensis]